MPDIPVRWDARVVRYLEFYRNSPRGRSMVAGWLKKSGRYGGAIRRTLTVGKGFEAGHHEGGIGLGAAVQDREADNGERILDLRDLLEDALATVLLEQARDEVRGREAGEQLEAKLSADRCVVRDLDLGKSGAGCRTAYQDIEAGRV